MSNPIAVVGEARGDFEVASRLIDETLIRTVEWVGRDDVHTHRQYVGLSDAAEFVTWQAVENSRDGDYRRAERRQFGDGLPKHDVHVRIRRAIYEFTIRSGETGRPTPFIVIVKDTDAGEDMRTALREAREQYRTSPVVIGIQDNEQECWLIAGFDPSDTVEEGRLAEICRGDFPPGAGFDPRACSERLTATKKDTEKLSPKRVLNHLVSSDRNRGYRGLHADNHPTLKERGKGNGLTDFLQDLEQRLVREVFGVVVQC